MEEEIEEKPIREEKSKTWIWIVVGVIIIGLIIGGYFLFFQGGSQREEKYTGPVEKVSIAEGSQPIAGLIYIAQVKNYFKDEGLEVTLQPHTSGKACLNAVLEEKADIGTVADIPIMFAGLNNEKIYLIATIENSEENEAIIARKDRGISTASDLKGKKIAVTLGTSGEFLLDGILVLGRTSRQEVEYINKKPEEMFDVLISGEVDAASTWNPHLIKLKKELGNNGIILYGTGVYTETYNLAVMQDFVNENPDTIKKVLRALVKAEEFVKQNPEESQRIIAEYIGMNIAELEELWDIYNIKVTLEQSLLVTLENEARWAIENNLTAATEVPNYLDYIYTDALEEVKSDAVTIIH